MKLGVLKTVLWLAGVRGKEPVSLTCRCAGKTFEEPRQHGIQQRGEYRQNTRQQKWRDHKQGRQGFIQISEQKCLYGNVWEKQQQKHTDERLTKAGLSGKGHRKMMGSLLKYSGYMNHEGDVLRVRPGANVHIYRSGGWHEFPVGDAMHNAHRISDAEATTLMARKDKRTNHSPSAQ